MQQVHFLPPHEIQRRIAVARRGLKNHKNKKKTKPFNFIIRTIRNGKQWNYNENKRFLKRKHQKLWKIKEMYEWAKRILFHVTFFSKSYKLIDVLLYYSTTIDDKLCQSLIQNPSPIIECTYRNFYIVNVIMLIKSTWNLRI